MMKKKFAKTILLLLVSVVFIWADKLAEVQDNFHRPSILIDNNQLYVWDKVLRKICIYSRKGFDKIAEFGRQGQGPGEFIGINKVTINKDSILVSSFPKLCLFSKKGKLHKELKSRTNAGSFIPFGSNFVGKSYPHTNHTDRELGAPCNKYIII
jgi:thioredoxin-related protein